MSRWRSAFQNDFAARMYWSVEPKFSGANHPPHVQLNGSAEQVSIEITACAGEPVQLSARGTTDPDGQSLTYRWWQYREASAKQLSAQLATTEGPETMIVVQRWSQRSNVPLLPSYPVHVILEVSDTGTPVLTRYRRAVIHVLTGGAHAGRQCPSPTLRKQHAITDDARAEPVTPGASLIEERTIGELMDNPATLAVLRRHLPELTQNPQIDLARGMTLRILQAYIPALTDQVLAAITADLLKVPAQ